MTNLYTESKWIADEALKIAEGDFDAAQEELHQICDSHEAVIYYYRAIQFCANNDTSDGEYCLEECGGLVQEGDSFGQIACRVAYATLHCAATAQLEEMREEMEAAQ